MKICAICGYFEFWNGLILTFVSESLVDLGPWSAIIIATIIVLVLRFYPEGPIAGFRVVPIGDHTAWQYDPWGKDALDGRLYGRGSYDMKGGIAAFIAATKAIRQAGVELAGDLSLHVVVDEEAGGGCGSREVVAKGHLADAVIVAEPTDGVIQPAEGRLTWLRVTITGRSAHAGWRYGQIYPQGAGGAPESHGVNAIEKGVKFVQAVRELEREWALHKSHPLLPPVDTPTDHPLIQAIHDSRADLEMTSELTGFPAVTDAAFYAGAGVDAVIYGPSGAGLHGEDEYVEIDSLTECAKVYAATILRWCGVV